MKTKASFAKAAGRKYRKWTAGREGEREEKWGDNLEFLIPRSLFGILITHISASLSQSPSSGSRMWVILAQGYLFLAIKREATGLLIKEGTRNKRELYYYFGLFFVEHMEASFRSEGRTPISEFRSYAIFALGVRVRTNYRKTHSILYRLFKKNRMSGLNALFRSVIPP